MRKELFQTVQRAAATERIQHEAQHDRARVHVHLGRHAVIDEPDEAQLVGVGFDNRQMWTGYTSISWGMSCMAHSYGPMDVLNLLLIWRQQHLVMDSRMRKGHQKKCDFPPPWGAECELEELNGRFIAALRGTTLAALQQQSVLAQVFPGGAPYAADLLSFRQAVHLAMHWGQIRTIRNLYRRTQSEPSRFFPDNPTFPA